MPGSTAGFNLARCAPSAMLVTKDLLFIHVPKTGGISATGFLLNNLPGELHLFGPESSYEHIRSLIRFDDVHDRLRFVRGKLHETLQEAAGVLAGMGRELQELPAIVAAVRNPYDLEVSHFLHLQKPKVIARRGDTSPACRLAVAGDFETFAEEAPFYGKNPSQIERFYTIEGAMPENLQLIRFESLPEDWERAVAPFSLKRFSLEHRNLSKGRQPYHEYLTARAGKAIYDKYRFLFDFYPPETFDQPR